MTAALQQPTSPATEQPRILLVACGKEKRQGGRMYRAADLYTGPGFSDASGYARAEVTAGRAAHWMILSGQHGLIAPDKLLRPYDCYLPDLALDERQLWQARVVGQLQRWLPTIGLSARLTGQHRTYPPLTLEFHAGAAYVIQGPPSWTIATPLRSLGQGARRGWYKARRVEQDAREQLALFPGETGR